MSLAGARPVLASPVYVGVAGDLLGPDEPRNHYLTKVGGEAWIPACSNHGDRGGSVSADPGGAGCSGKAGFPGPRPPLPKWPSLTSCNVCKSPLSLVLQAFAPLTAADVAGSVGSGPSPQRVLLLLGCTQPGCGAAAGSWRALRCQVPVQPAVETQPQQQEQEQEQEQEHGGLAHGGAGCGEAVQGQACTPDPGLSPAVPSDDPFGGGGFAAADDGADAFGDFGGFKDDTGEGLGGGGGGLLDFGDLGAALEASAVAQDRQQQQQQQQRHGKVKQPKGAQASTAHEDPGAHHGEEVASVQLAGLGPRLPEFYVWASEEPAALEGRQGRSSVADAHVQELLAQYQQREEAERGGRRGGRVEGGGAAGEASASTSGRTGGGPQRSAPMRGPSGTADSDSDGEGTSSGGGDAASAMEADVSDGGSESWAGEQYEEDHLRGVEGSYLKFAKRLARQPDQCARYSRGGEVLWPLRHPPCPPPCPRCGASRVFEFQLMAPTLAVVLDCAAWLEGPEVARHAPAINAAANWDLATVAVYTCAANCGGCMEAGAGCEAGAVAQGTDGPGGVLVVEEHVVLVNEEDCHVAEELKLA